MKALRIAVYAALVVGWLGLAWLLWGSVVPDGLALPHVDVDTVFGKALVDRAERYERFLLVLWAVGIAVTLATLAIYARYGGRFTEESAAGPTRDRDAPRDAGAGDPLADPAPLHRRRAVVEPPPRRLAHGLLRRGLRRLGRARRGVRLGLRRAARRDGARAPPRLVVVDSRRRRLHRDRGGGRVRLSLPLHRPRAARRSRARRALRPTRARRGSARDPAPRRVGQREHEPGERVRVRRRPLPAGRPLGHVARRPFLAARGGRRPRPRARAPLERPHREGDRLVRALRVARRPRPDAGDAAARRDGRPAGSPPRAARRGRLDRSSRPPRRTSSAGARRPRRTGRRSRRRETRRPRAASSASSP